MKRIGLVLLLVLLGAVCASPALAAPNLSLTVRAGAEGRAKANTWTTVVVDLNNLGGEITGELVVEAGRPEGAGGWNRRPQYVVPLTIAAGAQKRIAVEVPIQGWNRVNAAFHYGGTVVEETSFDLTLLSPQATLIGVLSGDELGIPALGVKQGPETQVVRLDSASMPSRASLLKSFNVIAISRFDTSALSKEQLQALATWVGQGGQLLIAGGPEWKRTLSPLPPELLPVSLTGNREVDLAPLSALSTHPLTGKGPVSAGQALRGQVIASADGVPLLVLDSVGAGEVLYLAADPGLEPLAGWTGQADIYARYLGGQEFWKEFNEPESMIAGALQRIPGLTLPSVLAVGGLLLGYLVLVGPVNYLVLKRRDRREWMWVTVPLLSVLTVAAAYGLSVGRRTPLLSHMITVTELSPGTGTGIMKSYVGVYAPSRKSLKVGLGAARLVKPFDFWGGGNQEEVVGRVVTGEQTSLELLGLNNYTMRAFSMEQDVALGGGLELVEPSIKDGALTARVRNGTDQAIAQVRLFNNVAAADLGTLAAGALSEPFTLALQQGAVPMGGGRMIMKGGVAIAVPSRPVPPPGVVVGGGVDATQQLDFIQSQVWGASFGWGPQPVEPGKIVVAGWSESSPAVVDLPELGRIAQGANLILSKLAVPIDLATGEIPPGIITGVPISGSQNLTRTPNGWLLPPETYTFGLSLPDLDPARVGEMAVDLTVYNGPEATLRLHNWKGDTWVQIGRGQPVPNWAEFVRKDGFMELQVTSSTHIEVAPPTVWVKGVSR